MVSIWSEGATCICIITRAYPTHVYARAQIICIYVHMHVCISTFTYIFFFPFFFMYICLFN